MVTPLKRQQCQQLLTPAFPPPKSERERRERERKKEREREREGEREKEREGERAREGEGGRERNRERERKRKRQKSHTGHGLVRKKVFFSRFIREPSVLSHHPPSQAHVGYWAPHNLFFFPNTRWHSVLYAGFFFFFFFFFSQVAPSVLRGPVLINCQRVQVMKKKNFTREHRKNKVYLIFCRS